MGAQAQATHPGATDPHTWSILSQALDFDDFSSSSFCFSKCLLVYFFYIASLGSMTPSSSWHLAPQLRFAPPVLQAIIVDPLRCTSPAKSSKN
jgi:hypothetical protein